MSSKTLRDELLALPNPAVSLAILDGGAIGKVVPLDEGGTLLIENCQNPLCFMAGPCTQADLAQASDIMRERDFPLAICSHAMHQGFLSLGWDFHLRVALRYSPKTQVSMDHETEAVPINSRQILQRCHSYKELMDNWGSEEAFLAGGFGYALGQEAMSQCYAVIGGSLAELSIATNPAHRRGGYGYRIANVVIAQCLEKGVRPMWSCQVNNKASLNLAFKLGFVIEAYYVCMAKDFGNVINDSAIRWIKDNDA